MLVELGRLVYQLRCRPTGISADNGASLDFSNVGSASGPRIWESGFARTTYANPTVIPDADRV